MSGREATPRARVILASASPRRSDLLAAASVEFVVEPSNADESLPPGLEPEVAAELLARRKALAVARLHRGEAALVLGADTIVALGSGLELELLGKPHDEDDARRLLRSLSGSRHRVVTGVAVIDCERLDSAEALQAGGAESEPDEAALGASPGCRSGFERTWVSMRELSPEEIEAYVASGEWRGKAGGYAIQETADAFVTELEEGGFDNVVGLPVALSLELLRNRG